MATRSQLIDRVLSRLGQVASGNPPQPEDRKIVDDQIDDILDTLRLRGIITLDLSSGLDAEVPSGCFQHLSAVIADYVSDDFGLMGEEATKIAARAQDAEKKLLMLTRGSIGDQPVRAEYF